jgi:hypothetical protein
MKARGDLRWDGASSPKTRSSTGVGLKTDWPCHSTPTFRNLGVGQIYYASESTTGEELINDKCCRPLERVSCVWFDLF